ncbi:MAG: ferritin-like domain-containing protein [Steroidobacter sp.]
MVVHFREGLKEQWQRVRAGFGARTPAIDSMTAMYRAELHELHSAEQQLSALADELWLSVRNGPLAERLSEYAAALRTREAELGKILVGISADTRERPDEAMRALVEKASRMAEQSGENVRDAVLVASIQRVIHYMIAEYGTIAAHAKALGRMSEAAHFAQQADLDKAVDRELSELAKNTLNPEATAAPEPSGKTRGH